MRIVRYFALWCICGSVFNLHGQSPAYFEIDAGALIGEGTSIHAHASAGAGYLISPMHGVGVEVRTHTKAGISNSWKASGVGLSYRFLHKGLYARANGGPVFKGARTWDGSEIFEYNGGGFYSGLTVGYRFRPGIFLALNGTHTYNMQFNYLVPDEDWNFEFERIEKVAFTSFSFTVGFSWPGPIKE